MDDGNTVHDPGDLTKDGLLLRYRQNRLIHVLSRNTRASPRDHGLISARDASLLWKSEWFREK
jgi:hypothetical protein